MNSFGYPKKQGLYDPKNEHENCGMGFVVNMKGDKNHKVITQSLTILKNLRHRGACGAEANTGDGSGLLIQIPHRFFTRVCSGLKITLPKPEQYGVGMVFLPQDEKARKAVEKVVEKIVQNEGQEFLGWRSVPTSNVSLGKSARFCEPYVHQFFVKKSADITDAAAFERKLYVIRRLCENEIRNSDLEEKNFFYVCSLSCRTIVYKGMLLTEQLEDYFPELMDPGVESAIGMVHSRFSTNTFPSWERAHPNRYSIHNGEINTLRGNVNWMHARQSLLASNLFGDDIKKIMPIIDEEGSDSAMFDNCLEFLTLGGRSLPHAVSMMIPEPWANHEGMSDEKKAFYRYHACLMEPWDGPASIGFTDGAMVGAVLDRNGLRPSRYYVTKDDQLILGSEVGTVEVAPENVAYKGRLQPGRMLLINIDEGRIVDDVEVKDALAKMKPYETWLKEHIISLQDLPAEKSDAFTVSDEELLKLQKAFGYSVEDLRILLKPMGEKGLEAIGSMGDDTPLAVLSSERRNLSNYFKQLFAQVTNPPIDAIREEIVTSTITTIGPEKNLIDPQPNSCRLIELPVPIITDQELAKLKHIKRDGFKAQTFSTLYEVAGGEKALEARLEKLCEEVDAAVKGGVNLIILSDKLIDQTHAAIPVLLAVSGLHHHMIRNETRTQAGIAVESAEVREVHHFATLLGYGAQAINPYLAFATLENMIKEGLLQNVTHEEAKKRYIKAAVKGIVKVMSKMGISTIQSYRGAQIFEALGLKSAFVDKYFTWTPTRIEGIGLDVLAKDIEALHKSAFETRTADTHNLHVGGHYQWRREGEHHLLNPETIHKLQNACRTDNESLYKEYAETINNQSKQLGTLRGLFKLKKAAKPIPIEEVESAESIMKRFKTGAMSYGSISKEAHESLAIAMNRIGGKSNTGEGGEDVSRFIPEANGDSRNSAIKQVASGRFGVTLEYLTQAREIQIKMAQGAKPGEGGQLPGQKVYPWIAKVRHSTPGVELISPPPHHDIYSIEDLAELIHDLKNANRHARINVKLVSEVGVGTIAAGVAKAFADVVLISGYDGGTGAAPQTSMKHAGLPWELGVAETHQTLVLNNLRSRIVVETDGQMKTGRDVVIATLLGAEEFGFATAPLVVLGCIMMRVCHLNTCPVGVATQDPRLRQKFSGDPAHVVNFFQFLTQEIRELMAEMGFRTLNEMIGRTDMIEVDEAIDHWKAKGLDFSNVLYKPDVGPEVGLYRQIDQDHGIHKSLDMQVLLELCSEALEKGNKVEATLPIRNINRVVGTVLGSELVKKWGRDGLPEDTVQLTFEGSAGQSFAAFCPKGMTMRVLGDTNDYLGKGLFGAKIIVTPPAASTFKPEENIIVGNVCFYGAIRGEAYIRGIAGERFCVRNSGVNAVVEGVGDHGCEYMTGGHVVILGKTGRNFGAGMSGGMAYIYDKDRDFHKRCNMTLVSIGSFSDNEDENKVKEMIRRHANYTDSSVAWQILANWESEREHFVKIIPNDYKRILDCFERVRKEDQNASEEQIAMMAFEENLRDTSRLVGN